MGLAKNITSRLQSKVTGKISQMPILILMPHSSCNCRCVMCDIWKANKNKIELSTEELSAHVESIKKLGVKWVVLSGGEALMHSNLWNMCELLKQNNIKISLLSTGLLMKRHRENICRYMTDVVVSLDGSSAIHNNIRNIPSAYEKLEEGIKAVREINGNFRITGRCVLQQSNFNDFPNIIDAAKALGLNQISFLAADVSTSAFNRTELWEDERVSEVALSPNETEKFKSIIEAVIVKYQSDFDSGFIAEKPNKIRNLALYYGGLNGKNPFPTVKCNAPWVSTVIDADGTVMPCFFLKPYGNLKDQSFEEIVNSKEAIAFRKNLKVSENPTCQKCVCTLNLGLRQSL